MSDFFIIFLFILSFLLAIVFMTSRPSTKQKEAKACFQKWASHKQFEWIKYALTQIPKLSEFKVKVKDKTTVSNFRKAINLYAQLEEIGFIPDLKRYDDELLFYFGLNKYPFKGMGNITLAQGLIGSTLGYLILSPLKTLTPYLLDDLNSSSFDNEKEKKEALSLQKSLLSLVKELKKTSIALPEKDQTLFQKEPEDILNNLKR